MEAKQIKLLTILAKKIKSSNKNKEDVVASLQDAKILTKAGNLTGKYDNLKKFVVATK